jgi:membrane protein implicated in regulation of membrane protease activity
MAWLWWVGGAIALGVIELLTLDLVFLMLSAGAFAGALAAGLGAPWWGCVIVFSAASVLMLAAVRPWALTRLRARGAPSVVTGAAATVGKAGHALTVVTAGGGRVKIAGEVWSAHTASGGAPIDSGQAIVVTAIDGAAAVVAPAA